MAATVTCAQLIGFETDRIEETEALADGMGSRFAGVRTVPHAV
ncbi:hypothetical protein [Streptomyces sp. NPDC048385]